MFLTSSEPQPENLSAEELKKESSELSELSRQHAKALEDDVFSGLTMESSDPAITGRVLSAKAVLNC